MRFLLATLHVNDMEKSVAFYHGLLGIPIVRRVPIGQGAELVFLGLEGQPNIELIPSQEKVTYSGFSIGFDVDDLGEIKSRLTANGYPIKREYSPNPHSILCFLTGPNGEEIELVKYK